MRAFDAILFDFDGVLADTEPLHWASWAEALAPHGISLDWETYRAHCIGLADQDLVAFVAARLATPDSLDRLWAEYPLKQELFRRRMLEQPPISAEVTELLESLAGYKLAIVSSSSRSELEPVLERAGLLDRFSTLVCREDVARHKPAPDPYLVAARRLSAERPLVVEDSEAGLESGRAAGFEVLHIPDCKEMPGLLRARLELSSPSQR